MPCKALQQNKSSIGLCRSQPFTLSHETGNSELFGICVTQRSSHMYDNCTCTRKRRKKTERRRRRKKRRRRRRRRRRGEILAALHGILGPTGAAVPGENPFTGYILASTVVFIRREAIKKISINMVSEPLILLFNKCIA